MFSTFSRSSFVLKCVYTTTLYVLASVCHQQEQVHALTSPLDRNANTIYYQNRPPNKDGDYSFEFQTTNGITTKAAGNAYGTSGVVQYISLEGIPVTMFYVADADGYHPEGSHILEIPSYIKRSIEYIRTHENVDERKSRKF